MVHVTRYLFSCNLQWGFLVWWVKVMVLGWYRVPPWPFRWRVVLPWGLEEPEKTPFWCTLCFGALRMRLWRCSYGSWAHPEFRLAPLWGTTLWGTWKLNTIRNPMVYTHLMGDYCWPRTNDDNDYGWNKNQNDGIATYLAVTLLVKVYLIEFWKLYNITLSDRNMWDTIDTFFFNPKL